MRFVFILVTVLLLVGATAGQTKLASPSPTPAKHKAALQSIEQPDIEITDERETLRDITRLDVLIEPIAPQIELLGLTTKQIQTDVETRLQQAGIPITSFAVNNDEGTLYININMVRVRQLELWAYSLIVEFKQEVSLKNNPKFTVLAVTWSRDSTGTVGSAHTDQLRGVIAQYIDEFVKDYLSMNPKPR